MRELCSLLFVEPFAALEPTPPSVLLFIDGVDQSREEDLAALWQILPTADGRPRTLPKVVRLVVSTVSPPSGAALDGDGSHVLVVQVTAIC